MASKLFVSEEEGPALRVCSDLVRLRTERRFQFVDVTELVAERVRRSGVGHGLVCVQTRHTTAAVVVNENEPLLLEDMQRVLEGLVPGERRYAHNDLAARNGATADERLNGEAHCKAMLLGTSECLTVAGGELQLGCWQRVFLVELDGPLPRTVSVTVMGVTGAPASA